MAKKTQGIQKVDASELESMVELPDVIVDEKKVKEAQEKLDSLTKEVSTKSYAVPMDKDRLYFFTKVINEIEWKGKEALGILEISKSISKISDKGIKNNVVFMSALEIEASHYFLNKFTSTGIEDAEKFISLFKSLEQALASIQADNKQINDLKTELAAAQQGMVAE